MDPAASQTPGSPPYNRHNDAQKQRDPGIKPLEGMTTSKLADKYNVKRNKIWNQCTLLRGQVEDGMIFFLDKVEKTIRACDNLLLTWKTHGSPLGDRKVKETMHRIVSRILEEIEQITRARTTPWPHSPLSKHSSRKSRRWTSPSWERKRKLQQNFLPYWNYWSRRLK